MCKTLNGGEWTTLNFTELNHHPGMEMFFVNRLSSIDEIFDDRTILPNAPSSGVPANIHGTHPFLIKIQQSIGGFDMLIYDRSRSFRVHCTPKEDPRAVVIIASLVNASSTPGKIYRWAKRVGDHQLSVCFDRAPQQTPTW